MNLTYNEALALPLLWASRKFANRFVMADVEKEVAEEKKKFYGVHVLLVKVKECRDGTDVFRYEIHG